MTTPSTSSWKLGKTSINLVRYKWGRPLEARDVPPEDAVPYPVARDEHAVPQRHLLRQVDAPPEREGAAARVFDCVEINCKAPGAIDAMYFTRAKRRVESPSDTCASAFESPT